VPSKHSVIIIATILLLGTLCWWYKQPRSYSLLIYKLFMLLFTEQGWEDIAVKQDQSDENQSEMKISLPSMPSLYIISFLFRACEEVHRVGGHVLDKKILHKLASRLLEKVGFLWMC